MSWNQRKSVTKLKCVKKFLEIETNDITNNVIKEKLGYQGNCRTEDK
jgi:predicted PP-loop superfamily ATPase